MAQIFSLQPHFQTKFDDQFRQTMSQQLDEVFAGCYEVRTIEARDKRFDRFGAQSETMEEKTNRAGPLNPTDIPSAFAWLKPRPYDKETIYDEFDEIFLGELGKPDSAAMMTHTAVAKRNKDLALINGMIGNNYIGALGTTVNPLPAAQQMAVNYGNGGVNAGLTLAKLLNGAYLFDSNYIGQGNDRYWAYSAKQLFNLLKNVDQVANHLYNDVQALRDANLKAFAGFTFKLTQLLPVTAAGIRTNIAWHKKLVWQGIGQELRTHMDILPTQKHALLVRSTMLIDATRFEDTGVVTALCDETV
jgi:hypothetical protein